MTQVIIARGKNFFVLNQNILSIFMKKEYTELYYEIPINAMQ